MSEDCLLNAADVREQGIRLPKLPSLKFRNLVSADGQTYYLLPTPVRRGRRLRDGSMKYTMLDFSERHPLSSAQAMFVGIKRGIRAVPLDCSFVDSKRVSLHNTPASDICAVVDRYARVGSGASLAMFDLPGKFYEAVLLKVNAVTDITFTGSAGANTVHLCINFEVDAALGGTKSFDIDMRANVQKTFTAMLDAKSVKRHLWSGNFSVRVTERGVFEFDAPELDGTLYLGGKLVA